jgi:iron complex outermembrane recepter protein
MNRFFQFTFFFLVLLQGATPLFSAEDLKNLSLSGKVMDATTGQTLPGASVYLHELKRGVVTNEQGEYIFNGLKKGSYHLHISFVGYEAQAVSFQIEDINLTLDIQLIPSMLELKEFLFESDQLRMHEKEKSLDTEVMDKEKLDKFSDNNLVNTISRIPGITGISMGTGVSKPVIRGMSFNRVVVSENGIKQEGQQWGADHGLEIDQYAVEQIEIIKGPGAIIYGSDASSGIIQIKPAVPPMEGSYGGSVLTTYRSLNDLYGVSAMAEGNHKGTFFRFRTSRQEYGSYRVPADEFVYGSFVMPIYDNILKNTAGIEQSFSGTVGKTASWGNTQLTVSNFNQNLGFFPGAFSHPGTYSLVHHENLRSIELPSQHINHFKVISNSNILLGKHWMELDFGYQNNRRKEMGQPHTHDNRPMPEGFLHLDLDLHTYSSNARFHLQHTEKLKGTVGASGTFQTNVIGGYEFLIPNYQSWDAGFFIFENYKKSEKVNFNAGARFDIAGVNVQEFTEPDYNSNGEPEGIIVRTSAIDRTFSNFSGAMGMSYFPKDKVNIKANLASHFRVPRAPELASNGIHHGTFRHEQGDPGLDSELGYQLDVLGSYTSSKFLVKFSPFFSYYTNYIYLSPSYRFSSLPGSGQIFQYKQAPVIRGGGELNVEYHLLDNLHLAFGADYVIAQNLETYLFLPFTPPLSLLGELEYEFRDFGFMKSPYFNVTYRYFSAQNRVDRNEQTTPSYDLINLALGFKFNMFRTEGNLYFQVQNLMDRAYLNHLSRYRLLNIPEPGRNFVVTLKVNF